MLTLQEALDNRVNFKPCLQVGITNTDLENYCLPQGVAHNGPQLHERTENDSHDRVHGSQCSTQQKRNSPSNASAYESSAKALVAHVVYAQVWRFCYTSRARPYSPRIGISYVLHVPVKHPHYCKVPERLQY